MMSAILFSSGSEKNYTCSYKQKKRIDDKSDGVKCQQRMWIKDNCGFSVSMKLYQNKNV